MVPTTPLIAGIPGCRWTPASRTLDAVICPRHSHRVNCVHVVEYARSVSVAGSLDVPKARRKRRLGKSGSRLPRFREVSPTVIWDADTALAAGRWVVGAGVAAPASSRCRGRRPESSQPHQCSNSVAGLWKRSGRCFGMSCMPVITATVGTTREPGLPRHREADQLRLIREAKTA